LKRSVFAGEAGEKYLPAPQEKTTSYVYDSFNPEARRFVWAQMREGYQKYGIKTFWLDADEPESFLPVAAPGKRFFNDEGRGWKTDNEVGMGWVQKHHRMIHDGEKTVFCSHFYIKMMVLPRQARDQHRKTPHKKQFCRRAAIRGRGVRRLYYALSRILGGQPALRDSDVEW
jgi:alpha-glucosidase (family GH31 glycosyl hydrolase)